MVELQLLNCDISWVHVDLSSFTALKQLTIFPKMGSGDDPEGHRLKASRARIDESNIFRRSL